MSDAKVDPAGGAPGSSGTGSGGGKAQVIGGLVGVLLIVAGAVAVGIVGFPGGKHDSANETAHDPLVDLEAAKASVFLSVPQIIVNLSDAQGRHLLQSTWTLEVSATDPNVANSKTPDWLPRIQDQMIKVLSSYRSIELEGGTNKEFVQTRIKDALNAGVFKSEDSKVRDVYFTEFVIQ